jgi:hypothetical protein
MENIEHLDYATMGETWEGFSWTNHRSQYHYCMWIVPPVKKKHSTSTSTTQEESLTTIGRPKEKDHILRVGIDDANTSKGMQQYKETRDKVVHEKEHFHIGQAKWAMKVFDPGI